MTIQEIKDKMKSYRDLFGGQMNVYEIENAKTFEGLETIFDDHHDFIADSANDAQGNLERFKRNVLKLNN